MTHEQLPLDFIVPFAIEIHYNPAILRLSPWNDPPSRWETGRRFYYPTDQDENRHIVVRNTRDGHSSGYIFTDRGTVFHYTERPSETPVDPNEETSS